jgi:hypothetical protein
MKELSCLRQFSNHICNAGQNACLQFDASPEAFRDVMNSLFFQ